DIRCAFYDLDLPKVIFKLEEKDAEVLIFEENSEGLSFESVGSEGLMHHKFCVLDMEKVVTGSMNPTSNGAYKNDNNLLVIESDTIARRYTSEFSQLGRRKLRVAPRYVELSGSNIELLFCPQEKCEKAIVSAINSAEKEIKFMTFTFTSDPIGEALLDASDRGVAVQGVFEKRLNPKYSEYPKLLEWGIDVSLDGNSGTMHHKVFIIDNTTVITGSYNPTWSASEKNDENLLIIRDSDSAVEFLGEFERVLSQT
ncbi:hypothetical protein GOV11_01090, partial [Candidatus Woesearchaeota archaeon]|nr:hypothetical protein [Candidatus Woesearchaeota archaeon]